MYKICIIDDERKAGEVLEAMLMNCLEDEFKISLHTDPFKALDYLKNNQTDLVFLDIKMPGMTGLELLRAIPERAFEVIFTTAYDQFVLQALRLSAVDYLLKPIDEDELTEAIKTFKKKSPGQMKARLEALEHNTAAPIDRVFKIGIHSYEKTYFFDLDQIVRCEASGNYTSFHFTDRSRLLSSKTLLEFDKILSPKGFVRIHKSHLINPAYIKSITGRTEIEMSDESRIPLASRRKKEILDQLSDILK